MTVDPGWVPPGTDVTKANVARVENPAKYWALVGVARYDGPAEA